MATCKINNDDDRKIVEVRNQCCGSFRCWHSHSFLFLFFCHMTEEPIFTPTQPIKMGIKLLSIGIEPTTSQHILLLHDHQANCPGFLYFAFFFYFFSPLPFLLLFFSSSISPILVLGSSMQCIQLPITTKEQLVVLNENA